METKEYFIVYHERLKPNVVYNTIKSNPMRWKDEQNKSLSIKTDKEINTNGPIVITFFAEVPPGY